MLSLKLPQLLRVHQVPRVRGLTHQLPLPRLPTDWGRVLPLSNWAWVWGLLLILAILSLPSLCSLRNVLATPPQPRVPFFPGAPPRPSALVPFPLPPRFLPCSSGVRGPR